MPFLLNTAFPARMFLRMLPTTRKLISFLNRGCITMGETSFVRDRDKTFLSVSRSIVMMMMMMIKTSTIYRLIASTFLRSTVRKEIVQFEKSIDRNEKNSVVKRKKKEKKNRKKGKKKICLRGLRDYAFRFENSTTKGCLKNIYIYIYIYVYVIYMNVYKYRYRYSITESFFFFVF